MAGRIRDEDIAAVRERSDIAEVIGEHVQLRNAGGGNLKGICPFHDEKSPSLSVSPARGLFHCFGCSAGGDVIRFVERIEHLSFGEAVENLASRAGIQLRYADGGPTSNRPAGQRARLVEAHTIAAAFYREQLASPEAQPARDFLTGRGFDAAASNQFGCGYAPAGWDSLTKHLLSRGFSPAELILAGLSRESGRGSLIDRFHRRLLWPIRDVGGYTDVMACHLAGVTTAVATCGTAFGGEHVNVIRRLWASNSAEEAQATTKVIFTFDGDAAGMKAAERAFKDEQKFLAQTFVAIDPAGKDPCDLRQSGGDPAVRALIESNVPMLRFMLGTIIKRFDVDTVEGRVAALNLTVPLVAQIKDPSHRFEYARELARLSGVANPDEILSRVRGLVRATEHPQQGRPQPAFGPNGSGPNGAMPNGAMPNGSVPGVPPKVGQAEREVIKAALQLPEVVAEEFDQLGPLAFLTAVHQQLQAAVAAAGGAAAGRTGPAWVERVSEHLPPGSEARAAVNALAVEPLRSGTDAQSRYAEAMVINLAEQVVAREVAQLKSRVQRLDATGDAEEQGRLFGQLMQLEQRRRALRSRAIGGEA